MTGSNPTDRSKLGTKRHVLTDKNGIPLSAVITSANMHNIKAVTYVTYNTVINRPIVLPPLTKGRKRRPQQHLCLDRAYVSESARQAIVKRGYVSHTPCKRKRGQKKCPSAKKRRWVVERTNSWHNRFRKIFTRYEKKAENYLGLVQLSCSVIIYRKVILG
jgi:transposase